MKKITFFTYDVYPSGGTERVMIMIANELAKKYSVEIISVLKSSDRPSYQINPNIKIIDLNLKKTEPLILHYPFLSMNIKKLLEQYTTDVFICVGMRYVPISIFMNKSAKYIAWEHYNSFVNKRFSVGDIGRRIASKKADRIVVLSDKDRLNNINLFKTKEDKIVRIYNPSDYKELSDKYDINSKRIVSVGRVVNQKGFDYLLEVARNVLNKHQDWQWDIFGDGKDKEELINKVKEYSLENSVFFKGKVSNMKERYKEYAMYVMTSRYEGFPMVNIEAHSARLPIVSFDCPCGPSEMILDGENGYLVDCFNIEKMSEMINYLIENPEIRQEFSDNTTKDKEKLKMSNIIKEWEKIIE